MKTITKLKDIIASHPLTYHPVVYFKSKQFEKEYRKYCDYYYSKAKSQKIVYDESKQQEKVRNILSHYNLKAVEWSQLNIFLIDDNGLYTIRQFIPAFKTIKKLFTFDWQKECGSKPKDRLWRSVYTHANQQLVKKIKSIHANHGIHVVVTACNPGAIHEDTITALKEMKIPTVRYNADDKHNLHRHLNGMLGDCPMAKDYTLCWTTTRECALWITVEGGRSIYLPEGAAPEVFYPENGIFQQDVSFLGLRYGPRGDAINRLRKRGIHVAGFGPGWENGFVEWDRMRAVFTQSRINIGIGGIGHSLQLTCLKGRDFEIPMAGGFYLTTYHPELAEFYRIGKQIICFKNWEEAVELIRYYLDHPNKAKAIKEAGHMRAINSHTWEHRFKKVFRFMGILA